MFTWERWNSLKIVARTTRRFYLAFPREESQYWPEDGRRISMHQKQHEKSDESKHGATYFLMGRSGKAERFQGYGCGD